MKITLLAAGFNLDLGHENRPEAVNPAQRAAQYRVLQPGQILDDDLGDFEQTPALTRNKPIVFSDNP